MPAAADMHAAGFIVSSALFELPALHFALLTLHLSLCQSSIAHIVLPNGPK